MPHGVVDVQQFKDSDAAFVASVVAVPATRAFLQFDRLVQTGHIKTGLLKDGGGNVFWRFAFLAVHPNEPLCQDADQRRSEEIVLDAHIDKPCYCTWRIIRMERAEDQMARKSGPDRNVGS